MTWQEKYKDDPIKYAEILKKQNDRRKEVMEKKYADPEWKANWSKRMSEGHYKGQLKRAEKEKKKKEEEKEFWKEIEDWTLEVEKNLSNKKEAYKIIAKLIKPYRLRKKREEAIKKEKENQKKFKEKNPTYHRDYNRNLGGRYKREELAKIKRDNKKAALEHLKLTTMTEEEEKRFRYDNYLMNAQERGNYYSWLKRRNLTTERTLFIETKNENTKPPIEPTKPKITFTLTKPERQMTPEEMQQAAGGP